jgi:putative ABC transport system substrate-binding protein
MKIYDKSPFRNNLRLSALSVSYALSAPLPTSSNQNPNFLESFQSILKCGVAAICAGIIVYFLIQTSAHAAAMTQSKVVVAVTQIVEHSALNAIRDGIADSLKAASYDADKDLEWNYQNAHGNLSTNTQIAHKFAGIKPNVIIAISTPSAQAAIKAVKNTSIPVVFTAVTDPLKANLVSNLEKPGQNVTGVSDFPPIKEQLIQIRKILPEAHKLGVVYNPGEPNSVNLMTLLRQEASQEGFELAEAAATKTADVAMVIQRVIPNVDALLIPPDNTLISVISQIVKIGFQHMKPVFTMDSQSVYHGALACIGFSYYEVGQATGQIVIKILQGAKASEIPIKSPPNQDIFLNLASAEKLGIRIPTDIVNKAKYVIREGETR